MADNCAGYGPGYMRVEGGNTCVQYDGHVRVDTNPTGSINTGSGSHRARPASLQTESAGTIDSADMNRLRLRPGVMGYAGSLR